MNHMTALGRRIVIAAALPVVGLLAVLVALLAGVKTSIVELTAAATAAVGAAGAAGLALRTNTVVGRLLRAIKGVTTESILATATQCEGSGAVVLSREATSLPERVGPLNPIGAGVVDLRRSAVEGAIRHADGVRQGFAAPLLRLAQRNQMLLDRQLAYLDGFEDGEADPDVLDRLFKLDQLATEMRRTNEGLMVLTGAAPASYDETPVELLDVVRGAASGVEAYARVRTSVNTGTWILGAAANDLAGLLAELIDNACRYSLPDSPVDVRATMMDQGVRIVVRDGGPGMIESRYAELNELLARPPLVDQVPGSAGLGLLIAAHLADRLGVVVSLRPGSPRGVVATVAVGVSLLADRAAPTRPLSMADVDGSVPLMVAQLRRRDRLASRQHGDEDAEYDEADVLEELGERARGAGQNGAGGRPRNGSSAGNGNSRNGSGRNGSGRTSNSGRNGSGSRASRAGGNRRRDEDGADLARDAGPTSAGTRPAAGASQAIDRYFSPFSPAGAPASDADPDALVAGTRPTFAPLPPGPSLPAAPPAPAPARHQPMPQPFEPPPTTAHPAYNATRQQPAAERDRPLFKLADVGAVPSRSLLGQADDLAAHGLVRRVPRASLPPKDPGFDDDGTDFGDTDFGDTDFVDTDFVDTDFDDRDPDDTDPAASTLPNRRPGRRRDAGPAPKGVSDRRSPDDVRRLFADRQDGIRRARMESGRADRRPRPGGNRP
jgi:signal transduction histidine kinase